MKTRTQTYLLLVTVLLIGFIGGFMVNGQLVKRKMERFRGLVAKPGTFIQHVTTKLELTPEQESEITPALQRHFERMQAIQKSHRQEMKGEFDTLKQDITQTLTEEQMKRFHSIMRRFHKKGRKHKHRKGQHPHPDHGDLPPPPHTP